MAFTLTLAGVDRTAALSVDSLAITDEINSRNTASFELTVDADAGWRPEAGTSVLIEEGASTLFAGWIDTVNETLLRGSAVVRFSVEALDKNVIADRHLVAKVYENETLGDIVADIVTEFLAGEGLTTTYVQTGPTVVKAVFNYCTAADAFNDLAELSGYSWSIDYSGNLHFFARGTNAAPFALTEDSANFRALKVKRTRDQYRNRQYVRAGLDLTDSRTESFKGDGAAKSFLTIYPIGKAPTVTVNAVSKTVGIRGVDTGKDWYWNKGDATLSQDDAGTVLTSSDTLAVTYQGLYPILLVAQDDAAITDMAALEGAGTGLYEGIVDDQSIETGDAAQAKADALLRRFARVLGTIEFETDEPGLAAGQLLSVTLPTHDLSGDWLVQSVTAEDVGGRWLRYKVKALDGEGVGGWVEFFAGLVRKNRSFTIRENEVVTYLRTSRQAVVCGDTLEAGWTELPASVTCGESLEQEVMTPESRVNRARVNRSEVGT